MTELPSPTPRWHPDGARRDVVAKQAARLFAQRGYHGASLRDIASASGVRGPTIYSHYSSKEGILLAVVNSYFDALLPRLEDAARSTDTATQRFEAMLRVSVAVGTEHPDEFLATSNNWEHIRTTPSLAALTARRDEASALWVAVLEDGAEEGSLRPIDTRAVFWIISSAVTGMVDARYAVAPGQDVPPTETLVTLLIEGLAPR